MLSVAELPPGYSAVAIPNTSNAFTEGCPPLKQDFSYTEQAMVTFVGGVGASIAESLSTTSAEVAKAQVASVAELPQRCARFGIDIGGIKGEITSAAVGVSALGEKRAAARLTMVVTEFGSGLGGVHMHLVAVSAGPTLMVLTVADLTPIDATMVDSLTKRAWQKAAS
ncbi:MAG TPA: hypothetical protein VFC19_05120 [Candidatus Limnocylindrales bacterium]|nr:hypothetical protein [Candidatus Limnocylindrales bacterium]